MNHISIQGISVQPIDFKNQRVLTTKQLAEFYGTTTVKIKQNYNNNSAKYHEGKHYFKLEKEELREFKHNIENFEVVTNKVENFDLVKIGAKVLFLWTERGALLHAKSLNTNRAWEVFEILEDCYFKLKDVNEKLVSDLKEKIKILEWLKNEHLGTISFYHSKCLKNEAELNSYLHENTELRMKLHELGVNPYGNYFNVK